MDLGHLLTRSVLTYPEVSSNVCHDFFCQSGNSVSLPWVIYCEAYEVLLSPKLTNKSNKINIQLCLTEYKCNLNLFVYFKHDISSTKINMDILVCSQNCSLGLRVTREGGN